MPMTLIFPVLEWIAVVILLVYWIIIMWFLASAGEFNRDTRQYEWNDNLQGLMIFHVFGLLWTRAWILAIGQLCIAGACADWFLATDKSNVGMAVFKSLGRSLRFHTGTAAFGAFLIAVVQMIRLAFRYYMWQISRYLCL
jgi:choline transporter-like protein 2/4/5